MSTHYALGTQVSSQLLTYKTEIKKKKKEILQFSALNGRYNYCPITSLAWWQLDTVLYARVLLHVKQQVFIYQPITWTNQFLSAAYQATRIRHLHLLRFRHLVS